MPLNEGFGFLTLGVFRETDLGACACRGHDLLGRCDPYPEYRVGSIVDNHWAELAYSPAQQRFGFAKRDSLPQHCRQCQHLNLCWGECPKNRFVRAPDGEPGLNYLCHGLHHFFTHIQRYMPTILKRVQDTA